MAADLEPAFSRHARLAPERGFILYRKPPLRARLAYPLDPVQASLPHKMTIDDYYDPRFLAVIYTAINAKPQMPLSKRLLSLSSTASDRKYRGCWRHFDYRPLPQPDGQLPNSYYRCRMIHSWFSLAYSCSRSLPIKLSAPIMNANRYSRYLRDHRC